MALTTRRTQRTLGSAIVLLAGLTPMVLGSRHAGAAVACRTDPKFSIAAASGGGYLLQVAASASLDSSLVSGITYAVHAPAGTALTSVLYTGGPLAAKETYTFVADQALNTFRVITTVRSTGLGASVTVSEHLTQQGTGPAIPTFLTAGVTNQGIPTTLVVPGK